MRPAQSGESNLDTTMAGHIGQLWTDSTGIILSKQDVPIELEHLFETGQHLGLAFDQAIQQKLLALMEKIRAGSYLETTSFTFRNQAITISIAPDMNSKRLTGFIIACVEKKNLVDLYHNPVDFSGELCRSLRNNPRIWVDSFRLSDFRIISWNLGAEQISGYTRQTVLDSCSTWGWLYPETEYRMTVWSQLKQKLDGKTDLPLRTRITCRDGTIKIVEWSVHWLCNSETNPVGVLSLGFDVTQETDYQNALRTSEGEYQTLADNSPDLIARFDQQLRCTYTNATSSGSNPFCFSRRSQGKRLSELIADKTIADTFEKRLREIFVNRHMQVFELPVATELGSRVFEIHLVPEVSPEEIIRSILFIARDITVRRRNEYRIRTAERFEAAGRVACELTHNINNRLTVLCGKLEILRRRLSKQGLELSLFDEILSITSEVSLEIRDSLTFGQSPRISDTVDITTVIDSVVRDIQTTASPGITFNIRSLSEPLYVTGSSQQLKNVLLNICINALDAMGDSGKLSLKICRTEILENDLSYYDWNLKHGRYLRIDIADTGVGIPDTIKTKIFDPLFTTKSSREGSGMGLATVYSIVSAMDGAIDFVSRVGEGSCFSILLPEVRRTSFDQPETKSAVQIADESCEPVNQSILWVDDNETVLEVAIEMVQTFGYQAIPARSGPEAIQIYRQHRSRINLVVLDVHMPEMDGWATHAALMKIDPSVRVVICTGRGFSDEAEKMMNSGAYTLLHKPFTAEDLLELIEDLRVG